MEKTISESGLSQFDQHKNQDHEAQLCHNNVIIKRAPIQRTMTKIFSRRVRKRSLLVAHSCPICSNEFQKPSDLIEHMLTHTGEKSYTCKFCENTFISEADLKSHVETHYGHSCNECGETFSAIINITKHLKNHCKKNMKSQQILQCRDSEFDDYENSYVIHSKDVEEKSLLDTARREEEKHYALKLSCPICQKEFFKPSELVEHTLAHNSDEQYSCKTLIKHLENDRQNEELKDATLSKPLILVTNICPVCQDKFENSSDFADHMLIHTGVDKPYSCEFCPNTYICLEELNTHLHSHYGHACNKCGETFSATADLAKHLLNECERKFKCEECGKFFAEQEKLQGHINSHKGKKLFACGFCEKVFQQHHKLKIHERIHTGEKPFSCFECGHKFIRKDSMRRHLMDHIGIKPYKCNICFRGFTQYCNMKTHVKTHNDEKNNECTICGKKFARKYHLKRHYETHIGEKAHSCDICRKSFTQDSGLKMHMITHSGKKPHSCQICGKGFSRAWHLKRHGETHDKEKMEISI